MKPLFLGLLLTGVLAAGLTVGLRLAQAGNSTSIVISPLRPSPPMTGAVHPEATDLDPAANVFPAARSSDPAGAELPPGAIARDPAATGRRVLAQEPGARRDELLRQFSRQWAATDLGGVIAWLNSLPDGSDRQNAARAVTALVAQDDPAGALELAMLLRTGLDDGSLEHRLQLWTEESPRTALDWIVRRPAGPLRDRLLARSAHVLAQRDPAEAASLVLDHMTPGDVRDEALWGVVHQWARRDAGAAKAWVAQFSADPPAP